jgi:hypothetical protein
MATGLARQGTPIHVTERILGHTGGSFSGIVSVYQRYSYQAECKTALEQWAGTLREIVGSAFP